MPRMLLDIQNRGQLAAGMTSFDPERRRSCEPLKDVGTVTEVFRLNHRAKAEIVMKACAGRAAIGHVRYATCGQGRPQLCPAVRTAPHPQTQMVQLLLQRPTGQLRLAP